MNVVCIDPNGCALRNLAGTTRTVRYGERIRVVNPGTLPSDRYAIVTTDDGRRWFGAPVASFRPAGVDTAAIGQDTAADQILATPLGRAWELASYAGAAAGAYHGYKRRGTVGGAILWGLLGGLFPIITIPVAVAQGFGKPGRR